MKKKTRPTSTAAPATAAAPAAVASPPEPVPPGEFAALIGLDWGDSKHALAILPRGGKLEEVTLPHSAERLHGWLEELGRRFAGQRVAVAVEATKGAIVAALLEHAWLVIYPIHPATSRRFSQAFTPSGAKDDTPDARTLLDLLAAHRHKFRALVPQDQATRRTLLASEARRKLVNRRTLVSNQLKSLLKGYYPQALELAGTTLISELALDFLTRWPELAVLQKARPATLRRFYYQHQVRRPELVEKRVQLMETARALSQERALCEVSALLMRALVAELRVLNEHIELIEAEIEQAFAAHPDVALFRELPGAGAALAPRLCCLFGTDRDRWAAAGDLQKYYGIAPVTEQSGQMRRVHWRWSAPIFARQSLMEWAGQTVRKGGWAKAYYDAQIKRGKQHGTILRALAFKWLRILWRCWQDRTPYDEARYVAHLRERKSPLADLLAAA